MGEVDRKNLNCVEAGEAWEVIWILANQFLEIHNSDPTDATVIHRHGRDYTFTPAFAKEIALK